MKWFYNLKISMKLIIGFMLVALIAGIIGVGGIINLKSVDSADTELYERNVVGLTIIGDVSTTYQEFRVSLHNLMLDKEETNKDMYLIPANEAFSKVEFRLKEYGNLEISQENRDIYNVVVKALDEYKPAKDKVIELVMEGKMDEAKVYAFGEGAPFAVAVDESIRAIAAYNNESAKKKADSNTANANNAMKIILILVIVGIAVAIFLGIFISLIISKPINKMVQAADKLALGDVDVNVEADSRDEIGSLAKSFEKMIVNIRGQAMAAQKIAAGDMTVDVNVKSEKDLLGKELYEMVEKNNEVLSNIASASEQVAAGSKQISDSSIALSQGATEQASSIEELTASLEEISSQTKLNAQNANQANELAENAKSNAVQGNTRMKEMLKAMEEINESSANISKIIKVIDEIAFQTNILALNAAVEAARAGQHGKGFAVVAEEVRNLAARSANAAKETTDMIEGSIKKSEGGTRIAKDTAEALNKIVNGIEKVANLVNDIAIASNEQSIGIGQINQGIMQVSEVVQMNSATSEEGAAASEELSSQAELLKQSVSKFKLKKINQVNSKYDEMSPEVKKMLEQMYEKSKRNSSPMEEAYAEAATTNDEKVTIKKKIALSDKEFGKY